MYDKFVGFMNDLTDVGNKMKSAQESYQGAMSKLVDGKGNLITSIEKLKVLGAKATKSIDQKLLDRAEE
ncbi:MAG: DNA recombination protein RmuC [Bacteroidota bacterium]